MIQSGETAALSNKTILITRPTGRDQHLRELIAQAGGRVIHFPVIQIQPLSVPEIQQVPFSEYSIAIFISRTAVEHSQPYFSLFPRHLTIVSIGSKTTEALKKHNIHVDLEAPDHNTESLLQTMEFQPARIKGRQILVFRGKGGRALLGDTLTSRGAEVRYVETYSRKLPSLVPLTKQQIDNLAAISISSNEGLDNLIALMHGPEQLVQIPLVVPSPRAATLAGEYGFKIILTADNATDEAVVSALIDYFLHNPPCRQ